MLYKNKLFGRQLKKVRNKLNLTQEEICDLTGLRRESISYMENSKRRDPHLSTVIMILNAIKYRFDDFWNA